MPYAQVAIPSPLTQLFTYKIPPSLAGKIQQGQRVQVPFRKKQVIGFCMSLTGSLPKGMAESKLKEITACKEAAPIFTETMLEWLLWLADYYMAPIGDVCKSALPARFTQIDGPSKAANPRLKEEEYSNFHQEEHLQLTSEQKEALDFLNNEQRATSNERPILLHGITGSGKTEIYLQFLREVLKAGKQAILLVPEIGLTPQLIGRVQGRLDQKVAIYHSGLSESWRAIYWEKMRQGEINVVVGTRSALFAPFKNLGAIIVDEEHDSSYKQGDGGFYYHARDAAIVRAKLEKATVILGSATPSLETFHNAKKGKYHYIYLARRATGAKLPEVSLIDLRKEKFVENSETLSQTLKEAISENLYRREQTLLLLNRRGFANFLLCQDCGAVWECPNCSISLTYHKNPPSLICHYCDYRIDAPKQCPKCQSLALKALGQGTQILEEELKSFFPEAKIIRLDKDTSSNREHRHDVLNEMNKGKVDILLGTQIVAKGHDFPNVTLVGVVLADTTLHLPDFRSAERTFQLLTQVAGRSGRAEKPGKVLLQTFHPENFSLLCAKEQNFEKFSEQELQTRQALNYPPFGRLTQIRLQGSFDQKVEKSANDLRKFLSQLNDTKAGVLLQILGPAKAPLAKIRGKHRWQILLKSPDSKTMKHFLRQAQYFAKEYLPAQVQLQIDVDCLHLM